MCSRAGPSVYTRLIPSFLTKSVNLGTYESVSNSETGDTHGVYSSDTSHTQGQEEELTTLTLTPGAGREINNCYHPGRLAGRRD